MKKIILASTSPRRRELLEKLGLKFQVTAGDYQEEMNQDLNPEELAKLLSAGKAHAVSSQFTNHIIISADTFIALGDEVLGKPHTDSEAVKMLSKISGMQLTVITGYTLLDTLSHKQLSKAVKTKVYIKKLSQKEITNYVNTGEPLDKSGAFAIQGIGATIVKKIEGDFYNVMGMPIFDLSESLKKFGIKILN